MAEAEKDERLPRWKVTQAFDAAALAHHCILFAVELEGCFGKKSGSGF